MGETRTKIIATIGPASSSVTVLTRMAEAGMNVARLNFSHGSHEEHEQLIRHIRSAERRSGRSIALLQDLQGPKMRLGTLPEEGIELRVRQSVTLSASVTEYTGDCIPVDYPFLHKDVKKGDRLFVDDGMIELSVTSVRKEKVYAHVVQPGIISSKKGLNLPDSTISSPPFTKKDHEDLLFGLEQGVDWVALSFVSSPKTIEEVRRIIAAKCRSLGRIPARIIAKVERKQAVDAFEDILAAADGIMIARGDLGIEVPYEQVPILQKEITAACREVGKPSIVATQMLHSMTLHPRATRAEISDVANAVIDHADAVMLSQESAVGEHPVLAVKTMKTVIEEAEASRFDDLPVHPIHAEGDLLASVAQSLHMLAASGNIHVIISSSEQPLLANRLSQYRPNVPIIVLCADESLERHYMLYAGVEAVKARISEQTFIHQAQSLLRKQKRLTSKMVAAYVSASPKGEISISLQ